MALGKTEMVGAMSVGLTVTVTVYVAIPLSESVTWTQY
jgi:hypothetical protein